MLNYRSTMLKNNRKNITKFTLKRKILNNLKNKNINSIFSRTSLPSFFKHIFVYLLKFLYKKLILKLFTRLIFMGLIYVGDVPLGIKQNTVIKEGLNLLLNMLLDLQIFVQNNFYILLIILNLEYFFIKFSINFATAIYQLLVNIIVDILELFRGKTYNKLKKRYDTVELTIDQIIMSVLLFSISILVYINIIIYYINFIVIYFLFVVLQIAENMLIKCIFRNSRGKNIKDEFCYFDYFVSNLSRNLNIKNIILGKINIEKTKKDLYL